MTYRLLHLSDLHFGDAHAFRQDNVPVGRRSLSEAVTSALQREDEGLEFDAVIVSGDIFTTVNKTERLQARMELESMRDNFPNSRWIVVPGNHDLSWADSHSDDRLVWFDRVIDRLALEVPSTHGYPYVRTIPSRDGLKPLAIVSLNSCKLEGPVQRGLGYVGDDQLDVVHPRLIWASVCQVGVGGRVRVAAGEW
jgi:3',5'-cyclic AMP phosphodiesterase CpdA